ncbi:divalent cation tolerance protein CutA, partial [Methylobacterium hispanicum]
LAAALKARHPYETPIILHLPVEAADPGTLAWILAETGAA